MIYLRALLVLQIGVLFVPNLVGQIDLESPDALLKAINDHGARYVVRDTLGRWKEWDEVMERISSGEKSWIQIARLLRPETDAGKTLALIVTMARALPNSPENVLPTIGQGFDIEDVCGFPFIEPERSYITDHYNKVIHALERPLDEPGLRNMQSECVKELNQAYARILGDSPQ